MATVRLIGEQISYSASPAMHAAAFMALGLDHVYELADVTPAQLPATVAALRGSDCIGANVTMPYKAAVIPLLDEVEPLAERADAVNTIVNRNGRLVGSNTDIPAIADEIRLLRETPRRVVILGAGGAARGVATALSGMGAAEPVMVSRQMWSQLTRLLSEADLLVNATPVGTNSDESPVNQRHFHPELAVLDLVYRPSPTRLVREACECGLLATAGGGVLFGQGWRSFETWLGHPISEPVKHAMAEALRTELGALADV